MNWRQKANYLAKRVREKGALYVIWLNGAPEDNPGGLGSTTDPDELRYPSVAKLAYYEARDGSFEADQILADVARALGEDPQGEAEEPARNPVVSDETPSRDPQAGEQVTGETQAEADELEPDPQPPAAAEETEPEAKEDSAPDTVPIGIGPPSPPRQGAPAPAPQLPPYWKPGDTALAIARAQKKVQEDHDSPAPETETPKGPLPGPAALNLGAGRLKPVPRYQPEPEPEAPQPPAAPERTDQPQETALNTTEEQEAGRPLAVTLEQMAPDLHPDAERAARARLYRGWLEAYEARDSDRLDAYEYLIGCLGAAPPATSRN